MRKSIFGLMILLASASTASAADCQGAGSIKVLAFPAWQLDAKAVTLTYHLDAEKPATKVEAHLYFSMAPDVTFADMALTLEDPQGLPGDGTKEVPLSQATVRALKQAVHDDVIVFACVNTMDYLDGSGVIID